MNSIKQCFMKTLKLFSRRLRGIKQRNSNLRKAIKPVYKDHHGEDQKVVSINRWSLFTLYRIWPCEVYIMTTESDKVTLTVRLIRSFDHRIIKHVVYHDVCLDQKVSDLKQFVKTDLKTHVGLPPPFKTHSYDTMKISHQPFGAKTSDPVINKENDEELMLTDDKILKECGVVNETELSFFNLVEYRAYQKNPTLNW